MKEAGLERIRNWFTLFLRTYKAPGYGESENILLKEDHSRRVSSEITGLAMDLGLSADDMRLAEAVGLLHDIGRFEQYLRYGTFVDSASVDHAELGARILEGRGILEGLVFEEKKVFLYAVRNHSRFSIPDGASGREAFFTKLLRDADKLDILKVMRDYYESGNATDEDAVGLNLPIDGDISPEVIEDIRNESTVNASHLRNQNDFKLLQISWVYDINFTPSMKRVLKRGCVEYLRSLLPSHPETDDVVSSALDFAVSFVAP